jgi:hypothetical protein
MHIFSSLTPFKFEDSLACLFKHIWRVMLHGFVSNTYSIWIWVRFTYKLYWIFHLMYRSILIDLIDRLSNIYIRHFLTLNLLADSVKNTSKTLPTLSNTSQILFDMTLILLFYIYFYIYIFYILLFCFLTF